MDLIVYDVLGREVARPVDRRMPPGFHEALFDAGGLPSGVYVYRLRAGAFEGSGRMVVVK